METLVHADIFFFVSTIALVFISVAIIVALVYVIRILRTVSAVSEKVKEESVEILDDIKALRTGIKRDGVIIRFLKLFNRYGKKQKTRGDVDEE